MTAAELQRDREWYEMDDRIRAAEQRTRHVVLPREEDEHPIDVLEARFGVREDQ